MSDDRSNVSRLEMAQPPAKDRLLKLLSMLGEEAAKGEVLAMVAITVRSGEQFDISTAGEIQLAMLAGMLGRAHLDVLEAMRGPPAPGAPGSPGNIGC